MIEEAIEDGIGAGRGDSNHVADHEGQHHVLCNTKHVETTVKTITFLLSDLKLTYMSVIYEEPQILLGWVNRLVNNFLK